MRTSMTNGEGVAQGIRRLVGGTINGIPVSGIMKTTRAKAGALAATSMNAFTNQARIATFQQNTDVIKGTQQLSTLDNLTSDICVAYSEQAWNVETFKPIPPSTLPFNGGPPRHFNCRSTLVPVLRSFQELGLTDKESAGFPVGTRASMDGQVPGDTTFAQFLSGKSKNFQDKLLGPKRAKLWRNDNITLTQLVDMRGNPMTVAQLELKAGLKPSAPVLGQDPDAAFKAALRQQQAEERAAKATKDAARLKKAEEDLARARKLATEKEAQRKAAVTAQKKAEKAVAQAKKEVDVVTGDDNIERAAKKLLRSEGFTEAEIKLLAPEIDVVKTLVGSFGAPQQIKGFLEIVKGKVAAFREVAKFIKALPKKIPVFKTSQAAEAWTRKNLINKIDNILEGKSRTVSKFTGRRFERELVKKVFDDLVAWGAYNKDMYRHVVDVTLMMSRRFNMKLPNFIGLRRSHVSLRFRGKGGEMASVHRATDSLLLPRSVTNSKLLAKNKLNGKGWTDHFLEREDKLYKSMLVSAEEAVKAGVPHSEELVIALKKAIKEGRYQNTVGIEMGVEVAENIRAATSLWETIIHESGHRIHGRFASQVDDILRTWMTEIRAGGLRRDVARFWSRQTSKYSLENEREFVAEQFTRYMLGQKDRIYPPLLEFFKSIDTVGKFGINNISTLISI